MPYKKLLQYFSAVDASCIPSVAELTAAHRQRSAISLSLGEQQVRANPLFLIALSYLRKTPLSIPEVRNLFELIVESESWASCFLFNPEEGGAYHNGISLLHLLVHFVDEEIMIQSCNISAACWDAPVLNGSERGKVALDDLVANYSEFFRWHSNHATEVLLAALSVSSRWDTIRSQRLWKECISKIGALDMTLSQEGIDNCLRLRRALDPEFETARGVRAPLVLLTEALIEKRGLQDTIKSYGRLVITLLEDIPKEQWRDSAYSPLCSKLIQLWLYYQECSLSPEERQQVFYLMDRAALGRSVEEWRDTTQVQTEFAHYALFGHFMLAESEGESLGDGLDACETFADIGEKFSPKDWLGEVGDQSTCKFNFFSILIISLATLIKMRPTYTQGNLLTLIHTISDKMSRQSEVENIWTIQMNSLGTQTSLDGLFQALSHAPNNRDICELITKFICVYPKERWCFNSQATLPELSSLVEKVLTSPDSQPWMFNLLTAIAERIDRSYFVPAHFSRHSVKNSSLFKFIATKLIGQSEEQAKALRLMTILVASYPDVISLCHQTPLRSAQGSQSVFEVLWRKVLQSEPFEDEGPVPRYVEIISSGMDGAWCPARLEDLLSAIDQVSRKKGSLVRVMYMAKASLHALNKPWSTLFVDVNEPIFRLFELLKAYPLPEMVTFFAKVLATFDALETSSSKVMREAVTNLRNHVETTDFATEFNAKIEPCLSRLTTPSKPLAKASKPLPKPKKTQPAVASVAGSNTSISKKAFSVDGGLRQLLEHPTNRECHSALRHFDTPINWSSPRQTSRNRYTLWMALILCFYHSQINPESPKTEGDCNLTLENKLPLNLEFINTITCLLQNGVPESVWQEPLWRRDLMPPVNTHAKSKKSSAQQMPASQEILVKIDTPLRLLVVIFSYYVGECEGFTDLLLLLLDKVPEAAWLDQTDTGVETPLSPLAVVLSNLEEGAPARQRFYYKALEKGLLSKSSHPRFFVGAASATTETVVARPPEPGKSS